MASFFVIYNWKEDSLPFHYSRHLVQKRYCLQTMSPLIQEVSLGSSGRFEVHCCESEDSIELHVLPEKDDPRLECLPALPSANVSMKFEKGDDESISRKNTSFASKQNRSWMKDLFCVDSLCSSSCSQLIIDSEIDSFSHSEKHISSNGDNSPTSTAIDFKDQLQLFYAKGIFQLEPRNKRICSKDAGISSQQTSSRMPKESPSFVSRREELYALRWNGHMPLEPMNSSEVARKRQQSKRFRTLKAKGHVSSKLLSDDPVIYVD